MAITSHTVRDIMTPDPLTLDCEDTVVDAARTMRQLDIGDVLVTKDGRLTGVLTDRDIVIRATADGKDPSSICVGDICSSDPLTISPDAPIEEAVQLMRERAIRRIPVVDAERPVGIISLGDLAIDLDPSSALADISNAPPSD